MSSQLVEVVPAWAAQPSPFGADNGARTKQIDDACTAFLLNKTERTCETYLLAIRQFFALVAPKSIEEVTMTDAAAYKVWMKRECGYANSTICLRLAALTGLFRSLTKINDEGKLPLLSSNPFDAVDRSGVRSEPFINAVAVEKSDFRRMLDALPRNRVGIRDRAVLIFLGHTGRRRSEAARLLLGDLDLSRRPYEYKVEVKGSAKKKFELPDEAYQAMCNHWVSAHRLGKLNAESAVFGDPGSVGEDSELPLHHRTIWEIVKRAAKRAGLADKQIKPHGLRHMYARMLDDEGYRVQDIKEALGHRSSATTDGYLGRLRRPVQVQDGVRRALEKA